MCKIGDIIYVEEFMDAGVKINGHSFIVLDDEAGEIKGLSYDFIASVMSSIKNDEQRKRKLSYEGNFPIANDDTYTSPDNGKDGYVKTDQFYFFNKSKLSYKRIGYVDYDIMRLIFEFIEESSFEIERKTDNL